MNKFHFIFNKQTLLILMLSLLCSFLAVWFKIAVHVDFIFLSLFIAFPLTFTLRESFRRREKSLEYLSTFHASLESSLYHFETSNHEADKKLAFRSILVKISAALMQYLSGKSGDVSEVQDASDEVFLFVKANSENFKSSFSEKILSYQFRINESIKFLLAARHHHTPWGVRAIILFGCYSFVVFYAFTLVSEAGFDISPWYVFAMTGFKGLILIALCNVQMYLENPFKPDSPDGIRLNDFQFTGLIDGSIDSQTKTAAVTETAQVGDA